MKVGHVVASLDIEWGGPPQIVQGIAEGTTAFGVDSEILSIAGPSSGHTLHPDGTPVELLEAVLLSSAWSGFHPKLVRRVSEMALRVDVLHAHELWAATTAAASLVSWRTGKPLVISPHGALDSWAFHHHYIRKMLLWHAYQRRSLRTATMVHALTEVEKREVMSVGISSPCVVIPNGVACDQFGSGVAPIAEQWFPELRDRTVILSLGRITPKKNLESLCQAFVQLRRQVTGELHLVIAGTGEESYVSSLRRILALGGAVEFSSWPGMVVGEQKTALMARANLFALPSHSEGFSVVVLEALASGTPVVVSPACKFPEVQTAGAGKVVEPDSESLTAAMLALLNGGPERLPEMGARARGLAKRHYDWPVIAERFAALYEEMLLSQKQN
jgi:glycosyltransferase involved in cell wall biosynthesis